jgi:hypothetical protein
MLTVHLRAEFSDVHAHGLLAVCPNYNADLMVKRRGSRRLGYKAYGLRRADFYKFTTTRSKGTERLCFTNPDDRCPMFAQSGGEKRKIAVRTRDYETAHIFG